MTITIETLKADEATLAQQMQNLAGTLNYNRQLQAYMAKKEPLAPASEESSSGVNGAVGRRANKPVPAKP